MKLVRESLYSWVQLCESLGVSTENVKEYLNQEDNSTRAYLAVMDRYSNIMERASALSSLKLLDNSVIRNMDRRVDEYIEMKYWVTERFFESIIKKAFIYDLNPYDILKKHDPRAQSLQKRLNYIRHPDFKKINGLSWDQAQELVNESMCRKSMSILYSYIGGEEQQDKIQRMLVDDRYIILYPTLKEILAHLKTDSYSGGQYLDKAYMTVFPEEMKSLSTYLHNREVLLQTLNDSILVDIKKLKRDLLRNYLCNLLAKPEEYPELFKDFFLWIKAPIHHKATLREFDELLNKHYSAKLNIKPFDLNKNSIDPVELSINLK